MLGFYLERNSLIRTIQRVGVGDRNTESLKNHRRCKCDTSTNWTVTGMCFTAQTLREKVLAKGMSINIELGIPKHSDNTLVNWNLGKVQLQVCFNLNRLALHGFHNLHE